jgi:hypothetical protein
LSTVYFVGDEEEKVYITGTRFRRSSGGAPITSSNHITGRYRVSPVDVKKCFILLPGPVFTKRLMIILMSFLRWGCVKYKRLT